MGYGLRSQKILEQAKALQSLGISLRSTGDLSQSQVVLEKSLSIAKELNLNQINSIRLS
ncbi:MAG: hypothetical protein QNJ32_15225 [Xenococcaceae cyanobacterium MO_167.B27]|nr:hypothetical protein [Xenococcaceae cyanobacterium MO_167.B27]